MLIYSSEILSIIKEYIETGVIDIVSLFNNESNSVDIDELVDAFCYLLALYKPDNFPTEYWFATLTENCILEQWKKGNTPIDDRWLIDITDLAYHAFEYSPRIINCSDYVVAGGYVLSLINNSVGSHDVDVFYIGDQVGLSAGDELFMAIREPYLTEPVQSIEPITTISYINLFQYS